MQQFLGRLVWRNLSIRAKTAFLSVLLVILMGLMALISLLALDSVRSQMENTVVLTVEMRLLAQNTQLEIENLQALQARLMQEYKQPGFDPALSVLPSDFEKLSDNVVAYNDQLLKLSARLPDRAAQAPIRSQVDLTNAVLNTVKVDFNNLFVLVQQLTTPETGTIAQLQQSRQDLLEETFSNHVPLASQVNAMSNFETFMIQSGSKDYYDSLIKEIASYETAYKSLRPDEQEGNELALLANYHQNADTIFNRLSQIKAAAVVSQSSLSALRNEASRQGTVTETQVGAPLQIVSLTLNRQRLVLLIVLVVVVVSSALLVTLFGRDMSRNLQSLLESARRFSSGNLNVRANVSGEDEFSQLGASFNTMASQLEGLISGLEQRVAERTRDLSITSDIGHAVVVARDPRELMSEIVELIRHRFGFYHAQIFLVDNARVNAMLAASTGTAGRELLARGHALTVGSQSVIGQVTAQGTPVIASDTDTSVVHKRNELLPDTRSEMALPMRIGERVIGALDVQSVAPNAFDQDDIAVFQIMADQLAVALENARLFNDLHEARNQIDMLESRIAAEAWLSYRQSRGADSPLAYEFDEAKVEPFNDAPPTLLGQAIQTGRLVVLDDGEQGISLAIPIRVRGEVIGAFGFGGETVRKLTDDDVALVEAVIDRVGLALENLRLMEQTSRRAEHEQIINSITAKIVGSTEVDQILQTTVKELGRVLRAPQTSVQLRREKLD